MNRRVSFVRLGLAALLLQLAAPLACGGSSGVGGGSSGDDGGAGGSSGDDGSVMPSGDDGTVPSGDDGSTGGSDGTSPSNGDGASNTDGANGGNDGSSNNGDGAATKDAAGTGGDGGACSAIAATCGQASDCCSHVCLGNKCAVSLGVCGTAGQKCAVGTDCCSGSCVGGVCGAAQCLSLGATCPAAGNACCTDTCVGGKCAPIGTPDGGVVGDGGTGGVCITAGNTCAQASDCCSGLCSGGVCKLGASYCVQTSDICYDSASCCTGICAAPNGNPVSGTNPGLCQPPPSSGGTNCTAVDGTLCDPSQVGCAAGCCSALCAPYGPTGVAICQQAQGCHVEGDLCHVDSDCCGGESPDAGVLGGGLVQCSTSVNGGSIGVCMTPTGGGSGGNACVPEGSVCHYAGTGYACPSTTKRADCCGPQSPKYLACVLDPLGVPRCLAFGLTDGGTDACRQTGQTCATAGDCCNGVPCVPDPSGQLTCAPTACIPVSGTCTSNADCCAGVVCVIPVGGLGGTCSAPPPPPPPPPPADAGTSDGGSGSDGGSPSDGGITREDASSCAYFGQSCASLPCCTGTTCVGGRCSSPY